MLAIHIFIKAIIIISKTLFLASSVSAYYNSNINPQSSEILGFMGRGGGREEEKKG